MTKYVYSFGDGKAEGSKEQKNLLGGKGANLAEMNTVGIPVPPGFTISTDVCTYYYDNDESYPDELAAQVDEALAATERVMGKRFGDAADPLLFSVRSGARVSMPGMMDTVLNLGLTDETVKGLIAATNNERLGWDSYRRFIEMFSNVVKGVDRGLFEEAMEEIKQDKGVKLDTELDAADLRRLTERNKAIYKDELGEDFPQDPRKQLWEAITAVFGSWNNPRAIVYRRINGIPHGWGTAVNVQAMVFGNMGDDSATGVAFTRDPATGAHDFFYGEFLLNAQGEDVVAGIRTPQQLTRAGSLQWAESQEIDEAVRAAEYPSLEELMPEVFTELDEIRVKLEAHYKDMQDIEFTIQQGKLWLLQTRTGKRTSAAAVKIAVDMAGEGLIDRSKALLRVDPRRLDDLLHPVFEQAALAEAKLLAKGLPASPGAATGKVVFKAEDAVAWAEKGEKVILVRLETSPEDIDGMNSAVGILTARGGMTSHAAVVARGMGKCCVSGCGELEIDYKAQRFEVAGVTVNEGDWISIDGSTGRVYAGRVTTVDPELTGDFGTFMGWADEVRRLGVRTNADTPHDAEVARGFGAEGIGLCRTEHMFFGDERILAMRQMIIADDSEGRRKALEKLLPYQREDFIGIFKAMKGLPVTIRALDPPLHEFLPHDEKEQRELAQALGVDVERIVNRIRQLAETNPMLGHRGCRLGIAYPEITAMQVRAIFEAACQCKRDGTEARPEVMIPLISTKAELDNQVEVVKKTAADVFEEQGLEVDYLVGTMIELPRAALTADKVAETAQFFSFGTNDLTQTTFGLSRDDSGKFLPEYVEQNILPVDPFQVLDQEGVGLLVEWAVEKGRKTNPNLKVGICGEHGGEPSSVEFCHRTGLNYVSCSPYRVPIARLAAAQAVVREG
ncbi:MAG: pyruvate, phosphate dikinase [Candidatus Coatesbacteria bacterium]|nr:pyruvate, phosphate dikinase [Candidatus Coatesbacteria bacterium]